MLALAPFEVIAESYDDLFSESPIGLAQRGSVWSEMDRAFHCGQHVLEINCGTGIDALYLARRGIAVTACDSSPGMIAQAQRRADAALDRPPVSFRVLPTEDLARISHGLEASCRQPPDSPSLVKEAESFPLSLPLRFDGVLSNFSGLNCIADLQPVSQALAGLVRPGGRAVLCMFGKCCLWEITWYLHTGNIPKAFRRLRRHGVDGCLAPEASVPVHYHSVRSLVRALAPYFRLERWKGVGVAIPPSYASSIPARFPRLFKLAVEIDPLLGRSPALRALADHAVLTFVRVGEDS